MLLYSQNVISTSRTVRILGWFICLAVIIALGIFRIATQAQFAFASLMLLPVLVGTWISGRTAGWLLAVFASALWGYADYSSGKFLESLLVPLLNALVHLVNYGITVELTRGVMVLLQREFNTARMDRLTGLLNRRGFMEMAAQQVSIAERIGASVVIAFIDLDRFKQLNDTKGHKAGDAALREIGARLQQTKRASDICGRIGGDEFCIFALESTPGKSHEWAIRLHEDLTDALDLHKPAGVSIGVACFESMGRNLEEMLRLADETMYEVKHAGKGKVLVRAF
ncbi:MAG: GGDEF domain-containing protein [Proteobacteria bacterium]|nr:GGDEF domain-containing protein [Pseudomonadota bacterium]